MFGVNVNVVSNCDRYEAFVENNVERNIANCFTVCVVFASVYLILIFYNIVFLQIFELIFIQNPDKNSRWINKTI